MYDEQGFFLARLSGATAAGPAATKATAHNSYFGVALQKKIKHGHTKFKTFVNDDNYYQCKNNFAQYDGC